MNPPIQPGATLGVLGSGQLGRMFALAARRMGYRVHTFSPDTDTPTGQVSDVEVTGNYDDLEAVRRFARTVDVVTFEFENIPLATTHAVAELVDVFPSGQVLHITQNRLREKSFLQTHGFPVTPFAAIHNLPEIAEALQRLGPKGVMKTADFGYDGKGQRVVESLQQAKEAFVELGARSVIMESWVHYDMELSVVAARGQDGQVAVYDPFQNHHQNHILDYSVSPAAISDSVRGEAIRIARAVMEALDVIGVLCVEMFHTRDHQLLINELAPRPHNSGHLTMDACTTSQFEQQVRTVCGLPLGSTERLRPAAMVNLMGELWNDGPPAFSEALRVPDVRLHLYGKADARPGRKMGHLTALADDSAKALEKVLGARRALRPERP